MLLSCVGVYVNDVVINAVALNVDKQSLWTSSFLVPSPIASCTVHLSCQKKAVLWN